MRKLLCVLLALAFAGSLVAAGSADCHAFHPGEKVALLGSADDPDVFVWDSTYRLETYQTGTYDVARSLLPHAWTVPPGTRAVVIACKPGVVHPKYRGITDDALGIIMLGGPYRGRSGWVMGQDLRKMRR